MADMFKLQVVTPDKFFYTGEVSMVELTTTEGEIGVYAQHIPDDFHCSARCTQHP